MNKKNKISVVICTFNEEEKIGGCLESVKWADEIVVVDDGSTDKTVAIAKKFTDKIFHHKNEGYVEPARNFAVGCATGDWILVLDADEQISKALAEKLREITHLETQAVGVSIPRKNIIFSKWIMHTGWWPDYQLRFFKKGLIVWPQTIHKQPELKGLGIELEAKEDNSIIHHHYETVAEYLRKMNLYTSIEAADFIKANNEFIWIDLIRKPFSEFLSRFFARSGYKDGLHGLVLAFLQAVSMFVVTLKVWEKQGFEEVDAEVLVKETEQEAKKMRKELLHWFTTEKVNAIKNPLQRNAYKLLRKFAK